MLRQGRSLSFSRFSGTSVFVVLLNATEYCDQEVLTMKMQATYGYRTVTCAVEADRDLSVTAAHPLDLCKEAVGYAVCRFLCQSATVSRFCARTSYELRLAKGRKARRRLRIVAPAAVMELGYGWTVADLCVTPAGVTVRRIAILDRYPAR